GGFSAAGARKASLLVGLVWGVWHWPLIFMSMKIDPSTPLLYPLVYLLTTCALSVLLSWVTLRSGSVWPAAVGHGAINAFGGLVGLTMQGSPNMLLGPLTGGLIASVGYFILALLLLFNRKAFAVEEEAHSEPEQAVVGV
ncbi:MAG: CPBP family intramembrane metalloprotease, partial [Chloroflexota bacterium]